MEGLFGVLERVGTLWEYTPNVIGVRTLSWPDLHRIGASDGFSTAQRTRHMNWLTTRAKR